MIGRNEYVRRRKQLMRMAGRDAIVIVPSAAERLRNNDAHYAFRQDSDFHYLTGFGEPEAVLALVPGRAQGEVILFCRERDPAREQWDGHRAGQEGAVTDYAMDDAFPIEDIDDILPGLIEGRSRVYYHFGRDTDFDLMLMGWVNRVRSNIRQGAKPPHEFVALSHLLHDLRLYKSRGELRLMRKSAQIAAEAHRRAMRATRPGMNEHEVEAELLHTFRKHGAVPSYEPIVGGGANGCVLHYRANNSVLRDGDLLLIDAGAEYACYASDITRTFPVNGRYSPEQRAVYDIVLAAQLAAIEKVRAGQSFEAYHAAAVRTLTAGLIKLGLLKGSLKANLESHSYRRFYMHKTGHWLGLDVHDVGDYRIDGEFRELEPGMVVTVEPGIYISPEMKGVPARFRGIGIRIEDDVVVTRGDPEVISAGVPKDADEIEALMASR
ncbi:MAG TPA: Xaa-Pro aminopeptidase [Dokdonella sp.]|uniref:Xaa-Pro aminopeptidase n=3 Tax=Dokdonella sp. TaxID=2291710 RepID=UPI002D0D1CE7|nr:Xaa-Pro aminopeptidase [Xanthomonadales bacterium]HQW76622.1 Xaa-Pro aminopeptidase [Dokdonella sp.]